MSRFNTRFENTIITRGTDHAVGSFVQVADGRYANSGKDEQGEGYVLDWDRLFGFSINLINAKPEDLYNDDKLKELTNDYCKSNGF